MAQKSFIKHLQKMTIHNKENKDNRKSVHITYKKMNGRTVKRRISPLEVRGNLVIAYDHKRDALRSFRHERIKDMEKSAFWLGFEKGASAFAHGAELAGLGTLAIPSIQALRGKPMGEHKSHKYELAGLGILAAPSVVAGIKSLAKRVR